MHLRVLIPDDAEAFSALRLLGLERHPEAFATAAEDWRAASPDRARAQLAAAETAAGRFVVGAFDEGGALLGFVGVRREARESIRHKGSVWGLFVREGHRRQGVGGALLDAAVMTASSCDGFEYLRAVVTVTNAAPLRVFEARGFVRYGLETGGLRVGTAVHDQAFLRRSVRDVVHDVATEQPGHWRGRESP
jgi:ribosomal protein S18 acetylase RimI-like enzyme